jgi:hypothetical protein
MRLIFLGIISAVDLNPPIGVIAESSRKSTLRPPDQKPLANETPESGGFLEFPPLVFFMSKN